MGNVERISQLIAAKGISVRAFEISIGASNGAFGRAIKNGADVLSEWLSIIVEKYPDVSPEWLLTGRGPMLRNEQPAPMGAPTFSPDHEALYKEVLAAKDKTIERDEQLIASLERRIRDLERGGSPLESSAPSTYPAQSARLSPPAQSNPPLRK